MNRGRDKPEAVVVVVRQHGRVLVIQRGPAASRSGYWAPLSGRIEPGEREEEAVVRETFEEVGLHVRPVARAWECETDDGRYRLLWWLADVVSGDLTLDEGEVGDARWIAPADFLALDPVFDDDRRFFRDVLPGLDDRGAPRSHAPPVHTMDEPDHQQPGGSSMAAEQIHPHDDGDSTATTGDPGEDGREGTDERVTATELLKTAFVDDEDPRFPLWLPLPGMAGAAGWAMYVSLAQGGDFLGTLLWPGIAIFALTTVVTWFGWQLEID